MVLCNVAPFAFCDSWMTTYKVSRVLGIFSGSVGKLTVLGHESQLPSIDAGWHWVVTVEDPKEWFVIRGDGEFWSLQVKVTMFNGPNYSQHFPLSLGISLLDIAECSARIADNFTVLYQQTSKSDGAWVNYHFSLRLKYDITWLSVRVSLSLSNAHCCSSIHCRGISFLINSRSGAVIVA